MLRIVTVLLFSLSLFTAMGLVSGTASAAARITGIQGDVTVAGVAKKLGDVLNAGDQVKTGAKSYVVLTFDDKQTVVLKADTDFKINAYRYEPKKPARSSSVMSLFRGGMRYVSGLMAKKNPEVVSIKTPVATMGIRGTDISLVTGSLYLAVANGSATMTTAAGTATFGPGSIGFASSATSLPGAIAASQLPAGVASSFSSLSSIPAAGAGAGASAGTTGATSGTTTGTATGGAAGGGSAAGAGAAASSGLGGLGVAGTVGAVAGVAAVVTTVVSNTGDETTTTSTSTATSTAP